MTYKPTKDGLFWRDGVICVRLNGVDLTDRTKRLDVRYPEALWEVANIIANDVHGDRIRKLTAEVYALRNPPPVPMILRCPVCHMRHIDKGDFSAHPHHTHACQECGECWRPAVVCTVGVQFLPGFKDES